jgi:hypothetical protein
MPLVKCAWIESSRNPTPILHPRNRKLLNKYRPFPIRGIRFRLTFGDGSGSFVPVFQPPLHVGEEEQMKNKSCIPVFTTTTVTAPQALRFPKAPPKIGD